MKIKKKLSLASKILFNVMAVLFGLTLLLSTILTDKNVEGLLSEYVFHDSGSTTTYNTGKAPVRYKTWYSSVEDNLNGNGEIAWSAQKEGTVLLKNENNALPLAAGTKVSLYGVTAYDPMYNLDGAGNSMINDPQSYKFHSQINRRQFFYDEFQKVGLTMNESLKNWYNSNEGIYYRRVDTVGFWGPDAGNGVVPAVTDANWDEIPTASKDTANFGKSSTAIFITGRMTNESMDLNYEGSGSTRFDTKDDKLTDPTKADRNVDTWIHDDKIKDYLAFTEDEKQLMKKLGENYDNVIVIFNQANAPQNDIPALLKEYGIEAAMWIGFPGSDGIKAVADLLVGKENPSGGLSAAWYTAQNNNPSTQNYAIDTMTNVNNVEGMYVGYRYAETRYEDMLLGSENAGSYDYDKQISYPFGYGLSYTSFEYSDIELIGDSDPAKNYYSGGLMASNDANYKGNFGKKVPDDQLRAKGDSLGDYDDLIMKVKVTNKGSVAGKEIVQIYLKQPITDQDKLHGVQKPAVQLIGYGKTSELAAGASEVVEIKIDANKWFAAYDSRLNDKEGGYVLSAGDYKLAAARNAHEAVNSIFRNNNGSISNEHFNSEYGAGNAANVATVTVSDARSQSYKYWTQGTTDEVHNLFSDIDPNMDDNKDNDVAFFSRYDWNTTAAIQANGRIGEDAGQKTGSAYRQTSGFDDKGVLNSSKIDAFAKYYGVEYDSTLYNFGWSDTSWQLSDMIGVEYDPARGAREEDVEKWAQIVGQMSDTDFRTLFSHGLRKTLAVKSIGKPATNDQNASNGFEWPFGLNNNGTTKEAADAGFMYAFDSTAKICYPTGYPCEGIIAASFNNEVAYLVGQAIGEDALWGGAAGLYGFGLGLQRNPYHGRAGEFYSDDSFLTGMMGAYETKGAQEKGLYVYNKHFD